MTVLGLAIAVFGLAASGTHAATGYPSVAEFSAGDEGGVEEELLAGRYPEEVMRDFRRVYPNLSDQEIRDRARTKAARAVLTEEVASSKTFGGTYFDFNSGVWNVYSTDSAEAQRIAMRGRDAGVDAVAHEVEVPYLSLQASRAAVDGAVADVRDFSLAVRADLNAVLLVLPPDQRKVGERARDIKSVLVRYTDDLPHGVSGRMLQPD